MAEEMKQLGCRIPAKLVKQFKADVRERKGKVRSEFGREVANAMREYLDASHAETPQQRLDKIEENQEKILAALEGEGDSRGDSDTHTHSSSDSDVTQEPDIESDGGVEATSGGNPLEFNSLAEYDTNYPGDRKLSKDALKEASEDPDDLEIDPDHVDYKVLRSRGMRVHDKAAVCAAIIRYEQPGAFSEEDILETASEVLGKRNAKEHFDEVVSHFVADPTTHPEISKIDLELIDDDDDDFLTEIGAVDGLYAPSLEYVGEAYFQREYGRIVGNLQMFLEKDKDPVQGCKVPMDLLWDSKDLFESYVPTIDDFNETYLKLLEDVLELQEELGTEIEFESPHGKVTSIDDLSAASSSGDGE